MRRLLDWIHRFDELVYVSIPMRSGHLFLAYRSGLVRLRQAVLLIATLTWYVVGYRVGVPADTAVLIGALLTLAFVVGTGMRRVRLTDVLLIQGASRAAIELGTERKPGWWRITGPVAGAIGADLRRLNRLPWPLPTGGDRLLAREEQLLAAADPQLRRFLQPTLTTREGYEPREVEAASTEPTGSWPLLGEAEQPGIEGGRA